MNRKQLMLGFVFASLFGGIIALGGYKLFEKEQPASFQTPLENSVKFSSFLNDTSFIVPEGLNFVYAGEMTTPLVVHIKSTAAASANSGGYRSPDDMLREFFGQPRDDNHRQLMPGQSASGSGVIISADGYIVTNNHVIEDANELEVTLADNRTYNATLVGTDPNTDIAVIKIDEENLPFIRFGDSDKVRVGQWVLAVGNPFELTSTVTAGIVSAKGRNIGILRERYGIESFIQTDAVVNPGNSGGALVNLKGELIGINTAIATPTGTYAGYSFAVPVSLVHKVVEDIMEFGMVQRAVLGIAIVNVNDPRLDIDLDDLKGVYVDSVYENSAASEAGIKKGDVIIEINDTEVPTVSELQDLVARNRPGDKIDVTYRET
jgi:Do/DeqQ family serine protease